MPTVTDELITRFTLAKFREYREPPPRPASDPAFSTSSWFGIDNTEWFDHLRALRAHLQGCSETTATGPQLTDTTWCGRGTCDNPPAVWLERIACPHTLAEDDWITNWRYEADTMAELLDQIAAFADAE